VPPHKTSTVLSSRQRRERLRREARLRADPLIRLYSGIPLLVKDRADFEAAPRYAAKPLIEGRPRVEQGAEPQADGAPHYWGTRKLHGGFVMSSSGDRVEIWRDCDSGRYQVELKLASDVRRELQRATVEFSYQWTAEAEHKALRLLRRLVTPSQYRDYVTLGMFEEYSVRSGVRYAFRRCRPTIAYRPVIRGGELRLKILAVMCLHPVGYRRRSFAGMLVPTDDVITHLQLMRGDEPRFWRKCYQHQPYEPEAGL